MLKKVTVFIVLLGLSTCVAAQSNNINWYSFLKVPNPNCGLNVVWSSTYGDSMLSRTDLTIPYLLNKVNQGQKSDIALAHFNLAKIYYYLDSAMTAYQHLIQARQLLVDIYHTQPTSENAYLIGHSLDMDQQSDLDDSAQTRYMRAIDLDADNYMAYFKYTEGLDDRLSSKKGEWLNKCQLLVDRLLKSNISDCEKAKIASQYADLITGIKMFGQVKDFFVTLPEIILNTTDSTNEDSLASEMFQSWTSNLNNTEAFQLIKYAANICPEHTQYLIDYSGRELFRIFSTLFRNTQFLEDDSVDLEIMIKFIFNQEKKALADIHRQLEKLPNSEKNRYPAAYYYLAAAEMMSSDFDQAYHNICLFNQLDPDNSSGYALHCGIVFSQCENGDKDLEYWLTKLASLNKNQCESYPTEEDCYRAAILLLYQGQLTESFQAFEQTIQNSTDRPFSSLIGEAVICLLLEDTRQMQRIISVLNNGELKMNMEQRLCYYYLQAVICMLEGQTERAKLWAQKATLEDPDSKHAQLLYSTLQSMR